MVRTPSSHRRTKRHPVPQRKKEQESDWPSTNQVLLALVIGVCLVASARIAYVTFAESATATWTGDVSSNWGDKENWDPKKVPIDNTDVRIIRLKDHASIPPVLDKARVINDLDVGSGIILDLNGKDLTVNGKLTNANKIRLQCLEKLTVKEWGAGGTGEYLGIKSVAIVACPLEAAHHFDYIVLRPQTGSINPRFTPSGGNLIIPKTLTIGKRGVLDTGGRDIGVGTLFNSGTILLQGGETIAVDRFAEGVGSLGKWVMKGNGNGKPDMIVMKTRRLANVEFDPSDAGETFVIQNGTSIQRSILLKRGSVIVQELASLSGGTLRIASGSMRVLGSMSITGRATIERGKYSAMGKGEHSFGDLLISGGSFVGEMGATLRIRGGLYLLSGSFMAPSSVTLSGPFVLMKAAFDARQSTFILAGAIQYIYGSPTFRNLTKTMAQSAALIVQPGATVTVQDTLTLRGKQQSPLKLGSLSAGKQWILNALGKKVLENLQVRDSRIAGEKTVTCTPGCRDSGNNTGWKFTP